MAAEKTSALRSPWVIAWIALVAIVLMVNGLMIFLAINNNPGLVVEDYYERGQSYSRHFLKRQERHPGWLMKVEPPPRIALARPALFNFIVVDSAGVPVSLEGVMLHAYRPSDAKQDFSVPMTMDVPGRYSAEVSFPLKGFWDVLVSVPSGDDEYHTPVRISVAAN